MVKEYNILLLGETGVGKSTFINAFANYACYSTLEEAYSGNLICHIPTTFTVTDDNFEQIKIEFGKDKNESNEEGQSATQSCRAYVFPYEEFNIRIIDTPGVGDTRGIDQDKLNFDNLLAFIAQYEELHAICILLKPNNPRITVSFEFCLKQLFCHLEKSASQNILFLFTNARQTFYQPGDTTVPLKALLKGIKESPPYVDIAFNKDSTFCFDNEAFRFLVAYKQGIELGKEKMFLFSQSWDNSGTTCRQLLNRIIGDEENGQPGMKPHKVRDTISINEARRFIVQLTQPLAEIGQNIQDNLKALDHQEKEIRGNTQDIERLNKRLKIPVIDLKITPLEKPITVCVGPNCRKVITVGTIKKFHYPKKCHDPCRLSNIIKEVVGDVGLKDCWAFQWWNGSCRVCGCDYRTHQHIEYTSETFETEIVNEEVADEIQSKEEVNVIVEKVSKQLKERSTQLEIEKHIITESTANFAHFLKNNAITPYNDAFAEYMKHLIENEKVKGKTNAKIMEGLEKMLAAHEQKKIILQQAMESTGSGNISRVTAKDVFENIEKLFHLEIMGKKIKQAYDAREGARKYETKFEEIRCDHKTYSDQFRNWLVKKQIAKSGFGLWKGAVQNRALINKALMNQPITNQPTANYQNGQLEIGEDAIEIEKVQKRGKSGKENNRMDGRNRIDEKNRRDKREDEKEGRRGMDNRKEQEKDLRRKEKESELELKLKLESEMGTEKQNEGEIYCAKEENIEEEKQEMEIVSYDGSINWYGLSYCDFSNGIIPGESVLLDEIISTHRSVIRHSKSAENIKPCVLKQKKETIPISKTDLIATTQNTEIRQISHADEKLKRTEPMNEQIEIETKAHNEFESNEAVKISNRADEEVEEEEQEIEIEKNVMNRDDEIKEVKEVTEEINSDSMQEFISQETVEIAQSMSFNGSTQESEKEEISELSTLKISDQNDADDAVQNTRISSSKDRDELEEKIRIFKINYEIAKAIVNGN